MKMHTPGPWKFEHVDTAKSSEITGASEQLFEAVCIIPHDDITADGWEEMLANARLIAAAPTLLSALTELLAAADAAVAPGGDDVACMLRYGKAEEAARAAIAQAAPTPTEG